MDYSELDDRKIRVLLVISNLEYGGAQRQAIELANGLDPACVELHICSLSTYVPLGKDLVDRDHRLHVIRKRFKYDLGVVSKLARLLRKLGADVIQSYLPDADIAARLAGKLASTPLVVGSERNTDYHLKKVQLLAYALTRRWVDLFIANSNAGAAFNSRVLRHDPSCYHVVHNGVNTEDFRPQCRETVRQELGLEADTPVAGMFASFKEQKNHPYFFAAARRLRQRLPAVRFLFVGDELHAGMHGSHEYRGQMDRLVDELEIRDRCLFLGNREDVKRLYPACDVTVLPSLFEGTPNVALESMACGVPVVATDVADNSLIVRDGETGSIVPLDDEVMLTDRIARILEDRELRATMGQRAREWVVEEFSTQRLAEKTEAVYREALARKYTGVALTCAG